MGRDKGNIQVGRWYFDRYFYSIVLVSFSVFSFVSIGKVGNHLGVLVGAGVVVVVVVVAR